MNLIEIIILSVALALDALIVCFSYGLILKLNRIKNSLKLAFAFGFFQFIMPILGWHFTELFYQYIKSYSKWVIFFIFLFLGLKFFNEAFSKKEKVNIFCISFTCLICLAIATSIDAFGAGISLKCFNINILLPSFIIGAITFILSLTGFFSTYLFKKFPNKYIEITGALLLIYLAIKNIL